MLPVPTVAQLATFTGRPEAGFTTFATQALTQATLLFSLLTQRTEYPTDPDQAALALNAILEMADRIYLEQPNATIHASAYQSETIGTYSYSKGTAAWQARSGLTTGLFWWDLAMDELGLAERSTVASGSVSAFERELWIGASGQRYVRSPGEAEDLNTNAELVFNAELTPRPLG